MEDEKKEEGKKPDLKLIKGGKDKNADSQKPEVPKPVPATEVPEAPKEEPQSETVKKIGRDADWANKVIAHSLAIYNLLEMGETFEVRMPALPPSTILTKDNPEGQPKKFNKLIIKKVASQYNAVISDIIPDQGKTN